MPAALSLDVRMLVTIQAKLERRFDVVAGLPTIHRMLRRPKSLPLGSDLKKSH